MKLGQVVEPKIGNTKISEILRTGSSSPLKIIVEYRLSLKQRARIVDLTIKVSKFFRLNVNTNSNLLKSDTSTILVQETTPKQSKKF